jgi:molybdate transport system regulatory protein
MTRERNKAAGSLEITVELPNGARLDAGDVRLIETIRTCLSILGAARLTDRSYRKTWLMVDALNRSFESRVIDTFPGRRGAGAEVTAFGERLVALYRSIERRSARAAAAAIEELSAACDPSFEDRARSAAPAVVAIPGRPE